MLAGVYLIATAGWELLLVGAASILAGVLYTGGPRPYGYEGLGEVFVFLFFGVVAVAGSYYAQTEELAWEAFVLAVPVGLLASAILVVNNVRDLETDRRAGKRTLAVRLGRDARARALRGDAGRGVRHRADAVAARRRGARARGCCSPWLAIPLALPVVRIVRERTDGPALNGALAKTGHAPARVLRAALRRACSRAEPWRSWPSRRCGCRCGRRSRRRGARSRERELVRVRLRFGAGDCGRGRGGAAGALRRRAARGRAGRARRYAEVVARVGPEDDARRAARGLPRRSGRCRRRSRRSTSRCGTARAAAPAAPWRRCSAGTRPSPSRSTRWSAPRTARARRAPPARRPPPASAA